MAPSNLHASLHGAQIAQDGSRGLFFDRQDQCVSCCTLLRPILPSLNPVASLLDTFSSRKFKAHELKEAVPLRSINHYNSQHTENLTRYTQDATSVTGMTGQSDSNLVMDPEDKERTVEDLKGYKVRL